MMERFNVASPIRSTKLRNHAKRGALAQWLKANRNYDGDDCLIWPFGRRSNGYGMATIDGVRMSAHRHMTILAHGNPPSSKHQAAHLCGKGHTGCCNPRHLSWKTPQQNKDDELIHGTRNYGSRNGSAKLSEESARWVKFHMGRFSAAYMALKLGVHQKTILDIIEGKTWKWVQYDHRS